MPIWEEFPYTNTHELNLDWIINKVKDLDKLVAEAIGQDAASTIIFANPIQWDINNAYGKYNLVLDSNYNAYLSSRDVPAGILLSDTAYWQPVGNFAQIMEYVLNNFATNQGNDPLAVQNYAVGDLLVYNETLYEVTSAINAGYTIDPGNNCSAVTMEDLLKALKSDVDTNTNAISNMSNDISTIQGDIITINNTIANISNQVRIKNHFRYYIDGTNGNDDNDGLTSATAFKTIDKFLSMSSKYTELRGYIISAGTYTSILGDTIAGVSIHISTSVPGVILEFTPDISNDVAFYGGHINLQGAAGALLTLKTTIGTGRIYSDLVAWNLAYVRIPYNTFGMYGSTMVATNCEFLTFFSNNSNVTFGATKFLNTDPNATAMTLNTTILRVTGTWTAEELTATGTKPFMDAQASYLYLGSAIVPALTNKYDQGLKLQWCYLTTTNTRLTTMAARATNGNSADISGGNNVFLPS